MSTRHEHPESGAPPDPPRETSSGSKPATDPATGPVRPAAVRPSIAARDRESPGAATLATRLEREYARHVAALAAAARRVRTLADPEAIHDVRVAARRLLAMLRVWRGLFRPGPRQGAARALRALRRRLGATRELEVHVEILRALSLGQSPATRLVASVLIGELEERLERRRGRAARRLRRKRLARLLARLEHGALDFGPRLFVNPGATEQARARVGALSEAARAAVRAALERPEDSTLHQARIAIKKLRYAAECWSAVDPAAKPPDLKPLRELQEILGRVQDRATLRDRLARRLRRARALGGAQQMDVLQPLIEGLEAERQEAVERFRRVAATGV